MSKLESCKSKPYLAIPGGKHLLPFLPPLYHIVGPT